MLTKTQQLLVSFSATVIGLVIAELVDAGFLAGIGMIVVAYIVLGLGLVAVRRFRAT